MTDRSGVAAANAAKSFAPRTAPYGALHVGYWLWLTRRLSPSTVRLCRRLHLTPNYVTGLSFLVGLGGLVLVAIGGRVQGIAGVVTMAVYYLLDDVDGALARGTRRTSVYGGYLDGLTAQVMLPFLYVSVGLHVFLSPPDPLSLGLTPWTARTLYLLLGWAGGAFITHRKLARLRMREAVRDLPDQPAASSELALGKAPHLGEGGFFHRQVIGMTGSFLPALFLAAWWDRLEVFLLIIVPATGVNFLGWLFRAVRNLRRVERRQELA